MIRPLPPRNERENVIPLINVVFLLLIFFMIAGQMRQPEALTVTPPHVISVGDSSSIEQKVLIDSSGTMMLREQSVTLKELVTQIDPETPLAVKIDQACKRHCFLPALKALQQAGIEKIQLLTLQSSQA